MNNEKLLKMENDYKKMTIIRNISLPVAIVLGIIDIIGIVYISSTNSSSKVMPLVLLLVPIALLYPIVYSIYKKKAETLYTTLEASVLHTLGLSQWRFTTVSDAVISLKSKQAVSNYSDVKFFKENNRKLAEASGILQQKQAYRKLLTGFLDNNEYKNYTMYPLIETKIKGNLHNTNTYNIIVQYISPAGRSYADRNIYIPEARINELLRDKSLLMSKSEYNKYQKRARASAVRTKTA